MHGGATLTRPSASRKWLITLNHASCTFYRDAADDRFAPEEAEQDPREALQITAPVGACWYGHQHGDPERDADEAREDPVHLLDGRVVRGDAHEVGPPLQLGQSAQPSPEFDQPHDPRRSRSIGDEEQEIRGS